MWIGILAFCAVPRFDCHRAILRRATSFTSSDWNGSYKTKSHCCDLVGLRTRLEHSNVCAISP